MNLGTLFIWIEKEDASGNGKGKNYKPMGLDSIMETC